MFFEYFCFLALMTIYTTSLLVKTVSDQAYRRTEGLTNGSFFDYCFVAIAQQKSDER